MIENIKELTVVDFYADWCGPCKMVSPILDDVCTESDVTLLKINVDASEEATKYGVMSIPTIMVVKDGEILERKVGMLSKTDLEELVNKHK